MSVLDEEGTTFHRAWCALPTTTFHRLSSPSTAFHRLPPCVVRPSTAPSTARSSTFHRAFHAPSTCRCCLEMYFARTYEVYTSCEGAAYDLSSYADLSQARFPLMTPQRTSLMAPLIAPLMASDGL